MLLTFICKKDYAHFLQQNSMVELIEGFEICFYSVDLFFGYIKNACLTDIRELRENIERSVITYMILPLICASDLKRLCRNLRTSSKFVGELWAPHFQSALHLEFLIYGFSDSRIGLKLLWRSLRTSAQFVEELWVPHFHSALHLEFLI